MINKTIIQGRIVADPELRHTQANIPVASFRVAWSEKYKETETKCFLSCVAWRDRGEFIHKYFSKGQEIIVAGKLVTREWNGDAGQKRSTLELVIDEAHFCGKKADSPATTSERAAVPGTPVVEWKEVDGDDELPF